MCPRVIKLPFNSSAPLIPGVCLDAILQPSEDSHAVSSATHTPSLMCPPPLSACPSFLVCHSTPTPFLLQPPHLLQVIKFSPTGQVLLTVGTKLQPGKSRDHFCKPTRVAVLR